MAEINLLGSSQTNKSQGIAPFIPLFNRLFVGLLVLVIALYGWFWYREGKIDDQSAQINDQVNAAQQKLMNNPSRNELLTRQGQIQDLTRLARNHFYWSILLQELPKMDLKTAQLLAFNANSQGVATMVVSVTSYADLDRFLQVFDKASVNQTFSDIQIKSVSKTEQNGQPLIKAKIQVKHRLDFIRNVDGSTSGAGLKSNTLNQSGSGNVPLNQSVSPRP